MRNFETLAFLRWGIVVFPCVAAFGQFKPAPVQAPPQPVPQVVSVGRGSSVQINLRAYGRSGQDLRFRIREQPQHGTLSTPENVDQESAAVTYTPEQGFGNAEDRFSYSIQSNLGVSAPGEVGIRIVDAAPIMVVPDELDFGSVLTGSSSEMSLPVENHGGGLLEGEIEAPEGWKVKGERHYRLARGEKQTFSLLFAPPGEREYRDELHFTGTPESVTSLRGTGIGPIVVKPVSMNLQPPGHSAKLEIENRTGADRTIDLAGGSTLIFPKQVTVPAHGRNSIDVGVQGGHVVTHAEDFQLRSDGVTITIPVRIEGVAQVAANAPAVGSAPLGTMPATTVAAPKTSDISPPAELTSAANAQNAPRVSLPLVAIQVVPRSVTRTSAEIVVPDAAPGAESYRVEFQDLTLDVNHHLKVNWIPASDAVVDRADRKIKIRFSHLSAGTAYNVRLTPISNAGEVSGARAYTFHTLPPPRFGPRFWVIVGLLGLLPVLGWRIYRQHRRL